MGSPNAPLTEKGILSRFWLALEQEVGSSLPGRLGMNIPSNEEIETYRFLGASPMMREWVGGRLLDRLPEFEYQLRNKHYEASMDFDLDDIRRDKTGQIMLRIQDLARRTTQHLEKLRHAAEAAGTSTDCYDGQYFFDSDHSEGDSGTQTNLITATEVTLANVADADVPTADELAKLFPALVAYMMTYVDGQGEPVNGEARRFLAVLPPNMFAAGIHAVTADRLSSGASNLVEGFMERGFSIDVACNPRMATTSTNFYFYRTDGTFKPYLIQEEKPVTTSLIGRGSEEEFKNNRWLMGVDAWRAVGYGLWQSALHVTLS
jgi:phage major head subunit gpT-like protein